MQPADGQRCVLLLGDVENEAEQVGYFAETDDFGADADEMRVALTVQHDGLVVADLSAGADQRTESKPGLFVGPEAELDRAFPFQLLAAPAEHMAVRVIDIDVGAVFKNGQGNGCGADLESNFSTLKRVPGFLLLLVQGGDVAANPENAKQASAGIEQRCLGDQGQFAVTICRKSQPFFIALWPGCRDGGKIIGAQWVSHFHWQKFVVGAPDNFGNRTVEQARSGQVAFQVAAFRVLEPDHVGQRLE